MLLQQPVKLALLFAFIGIMAVAPGCVVPKNYPHHTPFIFKTNINIQGNLSTDQKLVLQERLQNQLDDSLKTKEKTTLPLRKRLESPPAFDSMYAHRSKEFMNSALYLQGYFTSVVNWDSSLVIKGNQQRVTVNFTVTPGKSYKFDSISYQFQDAALQQIALSSKSPFLKKGDPYSADIITAELDRLLNVFRNEGYYRITKEDLEAERDTVFAALLNPLLDPFERLQLLQQVQQRQRNPKMNVVFKLRSGANVKNLRKYTLKNVFIYPDLDLIAIDNSNNRFDTVVVSGIKVLSQYNKFKPAFIASKTVLKPGEPYQLSNYVSTYGNFSQLGAWAQVSIDFTESKDSLATIDAIIRMYPNKKQDISVTLDGSYNTGGNAITTGASNLFGIGVNFGLNNRNLAKQAIQSSTNLRGGIELGLNNNIIQTVQTSLSHTISFPKLIVPPFLRPKKLDSLRFYRTQLNFSGSYTDRRDFFLLRSLNVAWGYEWAKKNHSWYYSPFNLEYVDLTKRRNLEILIDKNPNLQFSFNTGLVISQILSYSYQKSNGNKSNILRLGLEESGLIFGSLPSLDKKRNLFRYVKLDADYRHYINYKKTALVFRLYGGLGIPYGKQENGATESQLPFFKSFTAGGPYSMRAWQIRQLGVGSSIFYDTANGGRNDRFGNIQLEGNIEYRFDVGTFWGFKVKSALFTDIGNIWYNNDLGTPDLFKDAAFQLRNIYRDIAVAAGTGLRVGVSYFIIRLDWAYKIKDPRYAAFNNGWFYDVRLLKGQLQLGVNYPF
jgi:outer membrane protein insertion porin family